MRQAKRWVWIAMQESSAAIEGQSRYSSSRPRSRGLGQSYGEIKREVRASQASISKVAHAAPRALPLHIHEHPVVSLVVSGQCITRAGRSATPLKPGDMIFLPAHIEHTDEICSESCALFCVQFPHTGEPDKLVRKVSNPAAQIAMGRLLKALMKNDDSLLVDCILEDLAAEVSGPQPENEPTDAPWLRQIVEIIHDDCGKDHSLASLASLANVHPTTLSRLFRAKFGRSLGAYRQIVRAGRALREVASGVQPLSEICSLCGYADQSHMTRDFNKWFALTPAQIRQELHA